MGNKNAAMMAFYAGVPEVHARLHQALVSPSIYDSAIEAMARAGLAVDPARLALDWTQPTRPDSSVEAAWLTVYRDAGKYWELHELGKKLVDLETALRYWRFRHVTVVERVIGFKKGTGGNEGASYLKKMLDVVLLPKLLSLRTVL